MIYIDPPYNTGNDFIYNDTFKTSAEDYLASQDGIDSEGNRLITNSDSNGRIHTDWLNMIYPRLVLAKDLLSDDGVIFISIDDNESMNVKKICDEIFGEQNFIAQILVQLNPRGRNLDRYIARTCEYVFAYAKDYDNPSTIYGVPKEGRMLDEYNLKDEHGKYREIGLRNRNQSFNPVTRPNLYYPLYVDPLTKSVSTVRDERFTDEVFPNAPDGTKTCWTWMRKKVDEERNLLIAEKTGNEWRIFRKDYLVSENGESATTLVKSLWIDPTINNDYGKKAIKELFGSNVMSFPKAPDLLKKLLKISTKGNDLVMDFFSGSGTLGQSVFELNEEDGGSRNFILIQLPEKLSEDTDGYRAGFRYITDIGEKRVIKAGEKHEKNIDLYGERDCGLRVFKLDSSNMKNVFYRPDEYTPNLFDNAETAIKEGRSSMDLLIQVMLELGITLDSSIETSRIAGVQYYAVNGNDLLACFDGKVDESALIELAKLQPLTIAFRDDSFLDDTISVNCEGIFKQLSPATKIKIV